MDTRKTSIRKELTTAALSVLVLTLLLGIAYPLVVTGIGQVAFPGRSNGQQVHVDGRVVGSKIIGQSFAGDPRYFQSRPSGTTPADNAAGSAFANYGPNSRVTERAIRADVSAYIKLNGRYYPGGLTAAQVPVDAADTSASGLDPDISVANARIQAYRVAAIDQLPIATVRHLVAAETSGRALGFLGESSVNVLELNLAVMKATGK
jgi:K+-transporting ATPase ATPase C chain